MSMYFKPLRRKIGVATLMLACVLVVGWMRSFVYEDTFDFCPSRTLVSLKSRQQSICVILSTYSSHWIAISKSNPIFFSRFKRFMFGHMSAKTSSSISNVDYWVGPGSESARNHHVRIIGDFIWATGSHTTPPDEHTRVLLAVPYWSVVLTLTLLSAWLLLSKPRAKKTIPSPAAQ